MSYDLRYCRLCSKSGWADDMVKYGTRSYAHCRCFMERKTIKDMDALPAYVRQRFCDWMNDPRRDRDL